MVSGNLKCIECNEEIKSKTRKKYCSGECAYIAFKKQIKLWMRTKRTNDMAFKERQNKNSKDWVKNHREQYNSYHRRYGKKQREQNIYHFLKKEEREFLEELAKEQQTFIYIRKSLCEVPDCGATTNLIFHEVSYSPVKSVTLCSKHHSILHMRFLKKKKVRIRVNQ